MNRRQLMFRVADLLLIVPASAWLAACNKQETAAGLTATSAQDGTGHTHTYTISASDLSSPPTGGVSSSSSSTGHVHLVTLSAAQLASIAAGNSVTVTSGTTNTHDHTFTFRQT